MKYALVTGGSRGIGRAVSVKLAKMGFFVLINYHTNQPEAEVTLQQVRKNGGDGEILKFNVASQVEIEQFLGQWMAALIIVSNGFLKYHT